MGAITRRPAAKADLIEIYRYIARDSHDRAAAYLMRIEGKLGVLSNQPGIGAARLPGYPDVRAFPVGSHLLFYRPHSDGSGIELIRVMHAARDWQALIDEDLP